MTSEDRLISDESWTDINNVLSRVLDDKNIPKFWDRVCEYFSGNIEFKDILEFVDQNPKKSVYTEYDEKQ